MPRCKRPAVTDLNPRRLHGPATKLRLAILGRPDWSEHLERLVQTSTGGVETGEVARGADRRRLFTPEFKKQQIDRVLRGELTLVELTRELDVSPWVTRHWKRLFEQGSAAARGRMLPAAVTASPSIEF